MGTAQAERSGNEGGGPGPTRRGGWARGLLLAGLALHAVSGLESAARPGSQPVVFLAPLEGTIDLGLAPFVARVIEEAEAAGAAAVIFEINTFGGRVDSAVAIRDALLGAPLPTVAFINRRAISAGALISLAAETIAMAQGSTIGAATPVQAGQPGQPAQPVQEKTVSYVRKEFRATAESRGRPPLVAEAMVDADVQIPDLIEEGKLLTLTTTEALAQGVADFQAESVGAVLEHIGLAGAEIRRAEPNWAEHLVRFLTHPVLSSLLISVGMLGIILEVRTPGLGIPGAVGVASLALFFWGHWIVELAGWEELLLLGGGLLLLALEAFVIPGFGIAGILGIGGVLAGLSLSLFGSGASTEFVLRALGRVVAALLLAVLASLALLRVLPRLPFGRRLVLEGGLGAGSGYVAAPEGDRRWLGRQGTAISPLRPAGIARIEDERVDVVSDGELIESGAAIVVVRVDGNRIVVRRDRAAQQGGGT